MIKRVIAMALVLLALMPVTASALPQCDLIFTKPPSGDHEDSIVLPDNDESDGSIYIEAKCRGGGLCNSPYRITEVRDYYLDTLSLVGHGNTEAVLNIPESPPGTSTRLFVNELVIDHGSINWGGAPEDLVIIVYGDLALTQARIKGILYIDDDVTLTGQVQFEGAIAAGEDYMAAGNSNISIDLDALEDGDLSGICDNGQSTNLYYRIEHDGDAVTCRGEPVTIKVCNDASCNSLASQAVSVTLSPTSGWAGGNRVTVTGQSTVNLWHATAEPVTVSLNPDTAGPVSCWVNGNEVSAAQCQILYSSSALLLSPGEPLGCRDETIEIQAVRANSTNPLQCDPAFTGSQEVSFTVSALNPATPVGSPRLTLDGQTLPFGTSQTRTLTFDANGRATVLANYNDAGQLGLSARYEQQQSGETIELKGQSDFVVAPAGFHISSPDSEALCASGDVSCSAFRAAGSDFNLSVKAACWAADGDTDFGDNPTTPNFLLSQLDVEPELVAPGGGKPSTTGSESLSFTAQQAGVAQVQTRISEVGAFRWRLKAGTSVNYLGRTIDAHSSDTLGRFTPYALSVTANTPTLEGCNAMGYLAQPLGFATAPRLTVRGLNVQGQVTRNYNSSFWRLASGLAPRSYADESGRPAVDEVTSGTLTEENVGDTDQDRILWLDGTEIAYQRGESLVAPFGAAVDMTIDSDALKDQDGICYGDGTACLPLVIEDIGGIEARYGRMVIDNVYGSENQALTLPVRAEYYDGSRFVRNALDSCTAYLATDLTFDNDGLSASGGGILDAGRGRLTIAPAGKALDALAEYQLVFPHHLQWYWGRLAAQDALGRQCVESDGTSNRLCNPKARVTFGRFRGHDKVIFRRERLSE
ncbi:hypothetical protein KUV89_11580 [Marinobacter hydrocarbonoclasticus]|nr:hypothetical protein [Marinobacter nauticus]